MLLQLGNPAPVDGDARVPLPGPGVTYVNMPDTYTCVEGADVRELGMELARAADGITRLPDHEMFVALCNPVDGIIRRHSDGRPSWVHSPDHPELARLLSEFYQCPPERPGDVEETHWTWHPSLAGAVLAPGVIPLAVSPLNTMTNAGRNLQMAQMFGGVGGAGITVGSDAVGTSTGTGATTMTNSGATWGTTQYVGLQVFCGNRWGNIISHTTSILTIDQWYDPTAPGGAAGSTPGATTVYQISAGAPAAAFVGLTANAVAVGAGDTTLPSEITTGGGGLIRKIAPLAHSSGATTMTLTPVFTANGSDSLPVVIAKIGISPSIKSTVNNLFQTLLGTTATLSLSGDQLTVTDTVTLGS